MDSLQPCHGDSTAGVPPKPPDLDNRRSFLAALTGADSGMAPLSPRAAKKIFSDDSRQSMGRPGLHRGARAINFTSEEISTLAEPLKFALVGKFSHGYPSMQIIRVYFSKLGLRGAYSLGVINMKHIIIKLTNEEDYSRLWLKQIVFIEGFPMRLFKWTPEFNPRIESPIAPVWVRFPELPIHLFHKSALFGIASLIGTPLKIDEATADILRPSVARVCVEVDLLRDRPEFVWIGNEGRYVMQPVRYEKCPPYCLRCRHLGHEESDCRERVENKRVETEPSTKDLRVLLNKKKGKEVVEEPSPQQVASNPVPETRPKVFERGEPSLRNGSLEVEAATHLSAGVDPNPGTMETRQPNVTAAEGREAAREHEQDAQGGQLMGNLNSAKRGVSVERTGVLPETSDKIGDESSSADSLEQCALPTALVEVASVQEIIGPLIVVRNDGAAEEPLHSVGHGDTASTDQAIVEVTPNPDHQQIDFEEAKMLAAHKRSLSQERKSKPQKLEPKARVVTRSHARAQPPSSSCVP